MKARAYPYSQFQLAQWAMGMGDELLAELARYSLDTGSVFALHDRILETKGTMFNFELGKSYVFMWMTYWWVGTVKEADGFVVTVGPVSMIGDTGRVQQFFQGNPTDSIEVEPLEHDIQMNCGHISGVTRAPEGFAHVQR